MRILFIAVLFVAFRVVGQPGTSTLNYQLEKAGNTIHVELQFTPVEKDSSKFTYGQPAFGGQLDILKGLQHLNVKAPARFKLDSLSRTITFYYSSEYSLEVTYDIVDTRKEANTRSQLFRPIIMDDYLFIHGVNLFLTPAFRSADIKPRVSVQWKKFPDFPLFYTFDPDQDGKHSVTTTSDSIAMRFITGARDLTIKKFSNESGTNYLVLRSTGMPAATVQQLESFYVNYNSFMRSFYKDKRKIKYSLVLQPYLGVNHKISGVSFGNGFIGKYNKPDSLAIGERKYVIAHEIGHYYLSDLKAAEGKNNEGQWFDEGFNDYTTYCNLVRSGEMMAEEFETRFNKVLQQLYSSKIKNTPNEKIFENFWKLGDYQRLPYWRGSVFAFYLDNQISLATSGRYSIRNLLLDLQVVVKERMEKIFTNEEFIQASSKYVRREIVAKAFQQYIIEGSSIAFDSSLLMNCFTVNTKRAYPILTIVNKKKFMTHYQFK
ncbi:MAG TPA: hypothetical protein PLR06_04480 [Cyclobacteriaceae bacterium]|nr:hypothetical protein [Cyclobacteriaceae bacterium]